MKKLFIFALCAVTAAGMVGAQKSLVDKAKKLAGKTDKITEARALISEALQEVTGTNEDAYAYYVAGNIEWDSYDKKLAMLQINPEDPSISKDDMTDMLINGYNYYVKALPLDSLPNAKGEVKPKYSKDILSRINSHINDFYEAGATRYNQQKYYPDAYEAFNLFAEKSQTPDTVRAMGYFYAGVCAYSAKHTEVARKAFANAVEKGYNNPNGYIYQVACIESKIAEDSTYSDAGKKEILDLSKKGYEKFGLTDPFFISNIVDSYHQSNNDAEAFRIIESAMAASSDNAMLYGLRGWLNSATGKDEASIADYAKAVSTPGVNADIVYKAARKYYNYGTNLLGSLDPKDGDFATKKKEIKDKYYLPAMDMARKALELSDNATEKNRINNLIGDIDYSLSL